VHIDSRVFAGTLVGLVVGKAVGIFASVRTAARAARVPLPTGMTGRSLLAVSTSAGMGFSVSLFIAALAFSHPDLTASADLGVLSATAVAGVASVVLTVLLVPRRPEQPARAQP
jgi:NhaA family Na+:H+ antiporter